MCTDSQSVLTFLEELSGLISLPSEPLKKDPGPMVDPLRNNDLLGKKPFIRLKMSLKYPIEGSDTYAYLIEKINLNLLEGNLGDIGRISSCNKENDENHSKYGGSKEYGIEEITILNPTWVFDSISDYSMMSTA